MTRDELYELLVEIYEHLDEATVELGHVFDLLGTSKCSIPMLLAKCPGASEDKTLWEHLRESVCQAREKLEPVYEAANTTAWPGLPDIEGKGIIKCSNPMCESHFAGDPTFIISVYVDADRGLTGGLEKIASSEFVCNDCGSDAEGEDEGFLEDKVAQHRERVRRRMSSPAAFSNSEMVEGGEA